MVKEGGSENNLPPPRGGTFYDHEQKCAHAVMEEYGEEPVVWFSLSLRINQPRVICISILIIIHTIIIIIAIVSVVL